MVWGEGRGCRENGAADRSPGPMLSGAASTSSCCSPGLQQNIKKPYWVSKVNLCNKVNNLYLGFSLIL